MHVWRERQTPAAGECNFAYIDYRGGRGELFAMGAWNNEIGLNGRLDNWEFSRFTPCMSLERPQISMYGWTFKSILTDTNPVPGDHILRH